MSETSGELGMALGIAVMGSIGTVIYRNRMDVPDGIPNEAAESASDTLVAMNAEQLPTALADEIRMLAQAAFASGFQVVGILSSVLLIGIAVISMASSVIKALSREMNNVHRNHQSTFYSMIIRDIRIIMLSLFAGESHRL